MRRYASIETSQIFITIFGIVSHSSPFLSVSDICDEQGRIRKRVPTTLAAR